AALGVRVALRDLGLEVLDRDARRKRHRLLAVPSDIELVGRRNFVHELASLFQHCTVVGDQFHEGRGAAEDVVALSAAGVVGGDELRAGKNRNAEGGFWWRGLGRGRWCGARRSGGRCRWRRLRWPCRLTRERLRLLRATCRRRASDKDAKERTKDTEDEASKV